MTPSRKLFSSNTECKCIVHFFTNHDITASGPIPRFRILRVCPTAMDAPPACLVKGGENPHQGTSDPSRVECPRLDPSRAGGMRGFLIIRLNWAGKGKSKSSWSCANRVGRGGASRVRGYACCMCEDTMRFSVRDCVCWVGLLRGSCEFRRG